jgi:hypothetical protein
MDKDKLIELLTKATPGHWFHWPNSHPTIIALPENQAYGFKEALRDGVVIADLPFRGDGRHCHDSRLIAAMHEALPELLAENARMRSGLEAARAWFEAADAEEMGADGADWLNEGGWEVEAPKVLTTIRAALTKGSAE